MVYNFRGKVFAKKEKTFGKQYFSHIPTNSSLQNFLDHLDSHITDLQPTAFASFNTSARGLHCPLRHDQKVPTATTAQHGDHTAPFHPEQEAPTAPQ